MFEEKGVEQWCKDEEEMKFEMHGQKNKGRISTMTTIRLLLISKTRISTMTTVTFIAY